MFRFAEFPPLSLSVNAAAAGRCSAASTAGSRPWRRAWPGRRRVGRPSQGTSSRGGPRSSPTRGPPSLVLRWQLTARLTLCSSPSGSRHRPLSPSSGTPGVCAQPLPPPPPPPGGHSSAFLISFFLIRRVLVHFVLLLSLLSLSPIDPVSYCPIPRRSYWVSTRCLASCWLGASTTRVEPSCRGR